MPKEVVAYMSDEGRTCIAFDGFFVRMRAEALGAEPGAPSGEEFPHRLRQDVAKTAAAYVLHAALVGAARPVLDALLALRPTVSRDVATRAKEIAR